MAAHVREDCEYTIIECPYQYVGCTAKV